MQRGLTGDQDLAYTMFGTYTGFYAGVGATAAAFLGMGSVGMGVAGAIGGAIGMNLLGEQYAKDGAWVGAGAGILASGSSPIILGCMLGGMIGMNLYGAFVRWAEKIPNYVCVPCIILI